MASFEAKVGWKSPRKEENKNFRSVSFLPDAEQKIKKKQQKNCKNDKISLRIHFKPKQVGECLERGIIKITILFRSYSTRCRNFQKNRKKIKKIKKYYYGFISSQSRLEKSKKGRK